MRLLFFFAGTTSKDINPPVNEYRAPGLSRRLIDGDRPGIQMLIRRLIWFTGALQLTVGHLHC